ncbi:MAG: metal-dependent hydrolase [Ignavibacteria bacterium]|nr:metal-dependent hydrolase [Ignavibacteria bacterium]
MSKIIYHGHSFVEINHNDTVIYIDPFITGNPLCDINAEQAKCDYIILSHGHADHFGDTPAIASDKNVKVIATAELSYYLDAKGISTHAMNLGGSFEFPFGIVKLTLAHHSSSTPDGAYAGDPAGIIINFGEKTFFHAGDTALFYDMKLIGEMNKIDFACLPVGDNFTMGIDDAVKAAEFLNAKTVIPVHYNTFEVIKADADDFKRKIESIGRKCIVMNPGDSVEL